MTELQRFSEKELKTELERREKLKDAVPKPLPNPDFSGVLTTAQSVVNEVAKEHYSDEDNASYIFEAVMKAIYGDKYWDWHNTMVS